ncbi:MAG: hypothetical protein ACI86C_001192 [Candidatus Latescibacterota bacterium]|jgi:hypothetical protein
MSDFWLYLTLGFEHVLDWSAYDHVLFLIVLSVGYSFDSWRKLLLLVTLFTLGHTVSLIFGNYDVIQVDSGLIECLIPITIAITALYNVFLSGSSNKPKKQGALYVLTIFFGLIHGFGFAGYYKMIREDNALTPLLEFALGVELSQMVVVFIVLILAFLAQRLLNFNRRDWILVISSVVIGLVIPMLSNVCFGG